MPVQLDESRDACAFEISQIRPSRRVPTLAEDVLAGLACDPVELHPKYFYDERGSALFDQICDTPEYYLTRTEFALLRSHAREILDTSQPRHILELGAGTARKSRVLLDAWEQRGTYWPFDVSEEMLREVADGLAAEYPELSVHALVGDYTAGFANLPELPRGTLAMFLGSTLGNFPQGSAGEFLADFASHLHAGDYFLLGADLVKAASELIPAYNDGAGVTAEFNKNVLYVLNRELSADFDPGAFTHVAEWNPAKRQMEMFLVAQTPQTVRIRALDRELELAPGGRILTEVSRKFTVAELDALLERAGMQTVRSFVSDAHPYALMLARIG